MWYQKEQKHWLACDDAVVNLDHVMMLKKTFDEELQEIYLEVYYSDGSVGKITMDNETDIDLFNKIRKALTGE